MTRTTFRTTLLLLLLTCLLAAGVSAAEPSYEIDTTGFSIEDENTYYSLYKDSLLLPLNITYDSDDSDITRMVITTSVEQNNGPVDGLTYTYELADGIPDNYALSTKGKEYIYTITNIELNGTIPAAVTVNITGLEVSPDPYTISMNIYAGAGTTDFDEDEILLGKDVSVCNFFIQSTVNNTETDPVWNLTNNLTVNTTILTSANLPAGTYTSPWEFTEITRGNDVFSILLSPATKNITSTVWKQNGGDWAASASSVSNNTVDETIELTVGEADVGTESYLLEFTGKRLGDVSDLYPTAESPVNVADVDMILTAWASDNDPAYIPAERLIYGDVNDDGLISSADATAVFWYITKGEDHSSDE